MVKTMVHDLEENEYLQDIVHYLLKRGKIYIKSFDKTKTNTIRPACHKRNMA